MNESLKKYIHVQQIFAIFFLVGVGVSLLYTIITQGFNFETQIIPFITYIIIFYIPAAFLIFLLQIVLSRYRFPVLFLYYHVWLNGFFRFLNTCDLSRKQLLNRIACSLMERFFNQNKDELIIKSFPKEIIKYIPNTTSKDYSIFIQLMSLGNRPVVVRREDLLGKKFLPKWAFVSVLYFKPIKILKTIAPKSRLIIDLRNESYGIYNNAGKLFLKLHYLSNNKILPSLISQSKQMEKFIESTDTGVREFRFPVPFRWASGGIMPIAQYKGRDWFVLFLREIDPVGLNIANGASEDKDEYKNLYQLIYREFSEELILLDREPLENTPMQISQKFFRWPIEIPGLQFIHSEKFALEHQRLRKNHDGMEIDFNYNGPIIERIPTPFEVEITYHDKDMKSAKTDMITNVIYNINPTEFGIELLLAGKFKMEDDDYIIDGEYWNEELLVRQPVMLLSCEFIKKLYSNKKSLGTISSAGDCNDCRVLDNIPCGEYVLFTADIEFRKRRLQFLERTGSKDSFEAQRIKGWLDKYEKMFSAIDQSKTDLNSVDHRYLTTLCPVTWKSFEVLCSRNLI